MLSSQMMGNFVSTRFRARALYKCQDLSEITAMNLAIDYISNSSWLDKTYTLTVKARPALLQALLQA